MRPITSEEIARWIVDYVSSTLGIDEASIKIDATFNSLGFDSTAAVGMTNKLGDHLAIEIDPTACYDYPTIAELAACVAELYASTQQARTA
jgi:acyl carrier protein